MNKLNRAYSNEDLCNSLKDRDLIFNAIQNEIDIGILQLDDEQLAKWEKVKQLSPLERDVLFVHSQEGYKSSEKWCVSTSHIYNLIKGIKRKIE